MATITQDATARKDSPAYSGFLRYFPLAVMEVAACSKRGNDQHNPGAPMHWDRSKSGDELDALVRHLLEAGSTDKDGIRHSTKVAWRAMANLEKELEASREPGECEICAGQLTAGGSCENFICPDFDTNDQEHLPR